MYLLSFDDFIKEASAGKALLEVGKVLKSVGTAIKAAPWYVKYPLVVGGTLAAASSLGAPLGFPGIFGEKTRQAETVSYLTNKALHSLATRIRLDEIAAESFTKALASSSANEVLGLTKDVLSKNYENIKALITSPARKQLFDIIKKETPELQNVPVAKLQEAYHTMTKIAPTLSQDKNAVKSFLAQAVVSATGVDYNTIKNLAEAEAAVNKAKITRR